MYVYNIILAEISSIYNKYDINIICLYIYMINTQKKTKTPLKQQNYDILFIVHCTSFSNHYNLLNTEQNSINFVSLENHGRVEH